MLGFNISNIYNENYKYFQTAVVPVLFSEFNRYEVSQLFCAIWLNHLVSGLSLSDKSYKVLSAYVPIYLSAVHIVLIGC